MLLHWAQGGNYGAQRMYGAIGWGTMSLVAGVVIQHYGIYAGFACYTAVAVFAIIPLFLLPMDALHSKLAQSQLTARPTAAIAIAGERCQSATSTVRALSVPMPAVHPAAINLSVLAPLDAAIRACGCKIKPAAVDPCRRSCCVQ